MYSYSNCLAHSTNLARVVCVYLKVWLTYISLTALKSWWLLSEVQILNGPCIFSYLMLYSIYLTVASKTASMNTQTCYNLVHSLYAIIDATVLLPKNNSETIPHSMNGDLEEIPSQNTRCID